MNGDEILHVGDKVDLVASKGRVYRTMVEDRIENGAFLAGIPSRAGAHMPVYEGDDIYLVFYRESGRYITLMKVIAIEKRGEVRYMWMLQKSVPQKDQRREAYRVPVRFDVQVFEIPEEPEQKRKPNEPEPEAEPFEIISSRDISITGIAVMSYKTYERETPFQLKLYFGIISDSIHINKAKYEKAQSLSVHAVVKRCIPWRDSKLNNVGLQYTGLSKETSESIARFVLTEQQKQMQKRKQIR